MGRVWAGIDAGEGMLLLREEGKEGRRVLVSPRWFNFVPSLSFGERDVSCSPGLSVPTRLLPETIPRLESPRSCQHLRAENQGEVELFRLERPSKVKESHQ